MSERFTTVEEAIPTPEVAAYYRDFPFQLNLDHPHLGESDEAWERMSELAPQAYPHTTSMVPKGMPAVIAREEDPDAALAELEAEQRRRARELGLPKRGWDDLELGQEVTLEQAIPNPEVAAYYLDYLGEFVRAYPHLDLAEATERIESLAFKAKRPPRAARPTGVREALENILAAREESADGEPAWTWGLDDAERAEAERRLRARELGIPEGEGWNTMSERRVREWEELLEGGED